MITAILRGKKSQNDQELCNLEFMSEREYGGMMRSEAEEWALP